MSKTKIPELTCKGCIGRDRIITSLSKAIDDDIHWRYIKQDERAKAALEDYLEVCKKVYLENCRKAATTPRGLSYENPVVKKDGGNYGR